MKSIMTDDFTKCYLCGSHERIEIHHIMGGATRDKSTEYGLIVPLCRSCHDRLHFSKDSRKLMDGLRKEAQAKFVKAYPDKDWLTIFHRNYL
jgi:predicted HNH restriction endonuclease